MKIRTFWEWTLGVALATLPFAGGCDQESANSAPEVSTDTNQSSQAQLAAMTNAASPEAAEQQLEQAPAQVVSTPEAPPDNVNMSSPAHEVAKLAQGGVDESVMLSFVTNSPHTFNLSSDAIIYLNDIGVPGSVVTAMIQHDEILKQSLAQPAPAPATPAPATETAEAQSPPPPVVESPQAPDQVNGSSSYFYGSLSPYGNWIQVAGYGLCWQPTVVVANPSWQPYCDAGHWAYTDYGWCWVSDYSWGWAPFHYGRWFHHYQRGWCWAPDTVWGPAWVSWRYDNNYCGWAPLPPLACFTPGIGFSYFGRHVGFGFSFGLSADVFTFVAFDHFTDRHWQHRRVPAHEVGGFFHHTVVANGLAEHNRRIVNEGIPLSRVMAATHKEVPRMHIRETGDLASARLDRVERPGGTLTVFRPNLPSPTHQTALVGQGIRPNIQPGSPARVLRSPTAVENQRIRQAPGVPGVVSSSPGRPASPPIFRNSPSTSSQKQAQPVLNPQGPASTPPSPHPKPLIARSWEQPKPSVTTPAAQPQFQQQSPKVFHQESPKYLQQDQKVFTQPATPAHNPPSRSYQWAPAAEPREQQHWSSPPQHAPPPSYSQPAPSAPAHIQSAPSPARNSPPPADGRGSGQGNGNSNRNR